MNAPNDPEKSSGRKSGGRWKLVLATIVLVGLAAGQWAWDAYHGPRCGPHRVSEWVRQIEAHYNSRDLHGLNRLTTELRKSGEAAIPVYRRLLRSRIPFHIRIYEQIRTRVAPKSAKPAKAIWAVNRTRQLQMLGLNGIAMLKSAESESVVPELCKLLEESWEISWPAVGILKRMGPRANTAIPSLIAALGRPNDGFPHREILDTLVAIGPRDPRVFAALRDRLNYPDVDVCLSATGALWQMGCSPALVIVPLKGILESKHPTWRLRVVGQLAIIAKTERAVLPLLQQVVDDPNYEIRLLAARTLWERDGQTEIYLKVLQSVLSESNATARWQAIVALEPFAATNPAVVPAHKRGLDDATWNIRARTATALGALGPSGVPAIPALERLEKDEYAGVRDAASHALEKLNRRR